MSTSAALADYRQRLAYQAGLLGLVATLAAGLLALGHLATRGPIAERQQEDLSRSLAEVVPARLYDSPLAARPRDIHTAAGGQVRVYRALRGGAVTGVAFQVTGQGYGGAIQLILGLDTEGRILGVRVLSHHETPGLGDHIEADKDDWILRFAGRSLGDPPAERWAVKKDGGVFDQFSGATITPRGVVRAIRSGLELFQANRKALLR
jgi:H+/Na+-translocating ferredoxin:NAD+ oxidoreductase subunit G